MLNIKVGTSISCFICSIFLLVVSQSRLKGQTIADNWYFGHKAGVVFSNNEAVAVSNGELHTSEGVATISNDEGELLFYSEGDSVWNRLHEVMPNGTGLLGQESATQSAVVCSKPGNSDIFYLFTVTINGQPDGLRYSIVDMSLDGGFGDIDTNNKNILIETPVCEKVTAVQKCDRSGYWILTYAFDTNLVSAYELTVSGLNTTPVYSQSSLTITSGAQGYLKCSPDGRFIAACHESEDVVEIFKFNTQNGMLSQPIVLPIEHPNPNFTSRPYGLEFSPNSSLLYVCSRSTNPGFIWQFDLAEYDSASIMNSGYLFADTLTTNALQIGPNQKLYCSSFVSLHEISNPNGLGSSMSFQPNSVDLMGRYAANGLPNFIQSTFFNPIPNLTICENETLVVSSMDSCIISRLWNFGDTVSGSNNTSTEDTAYHVFEFPGEYVVSLILEYPFESDTFHNTITVHQGIDDSTLVDTVFFCDSIIYSPLINRSDISYLWPDGSQNDSFLITSEGNYEVILSNACDTIQHNFVAIKQFPQNVSLIRDTQLCVDDSIILHSGVINSDVHWSTGDIGASTIVRPWLYDTSLLEIICSASNTCYFDSDTILLTINRPPQVNLQDTIACGGGPVYLNHQNLQGVKYVWDDSTSDETLKVDSTGVRWLFASNKCGVSSDSILVEIYDPIDVRLGEDTVICEGDSIFLNAYFEGSTYHWNIDSSESRITDSAIVVGSEGNYIVTVTKGKCELVDSRRITVGSQCDSLPCKLYVPNVFSPNGDGINDVLNIIGSCISSQFTLNIYNRWGQLSFSTTNQNVSWDGFVNGSPVSEGVYYYVIRIEMEDSSKEYLGSFTLMR